MTPPEIQPTPSLKGTQNNLEVCLAYNEKGWGLRVIKAARLFQSAGFDTNPKEWKTLLDRLAGVLRLKVVDKAYRGDACAPWFAYVSSSGPLTVERASTEKAPPQHANARRGFIHHNKKARQHFINNYKKGQARS